MSQAQGSKKQSAKSRPRLGGKVVGLTLVGLLVLLGAAYGGLYLYAGDRTPRNASVEGVAIGDLSPAEATARLRDGLAVREQQPIRVSLGDGRNEEIDPAAAGLSVDYEDSVANAGGGASLSLRRIWAVVTGGGDTRAQTDVDQSRMQTTLDDLDKAIGQQPVEGTVEFRKGKAVAVRSEPGVVVQRSATQTLLQQQFLREGSRKVPTEVEQPYVTDEEVTRALEEFGKPAMSGPVTLVLGGQEVVAPPRLFGRGLSMIPNDGALVPRVDGQAIITALEPVMRTVGAEPVDARFEVRGGKPVLVPAKVGVEIDPTELEGGFAEAAAGTGKARRLKIEGRVSQPDFSTAEARKLKIKEQVSTFPTYFPYAEYRNVNLSRAAELIDGVVLKPGEVFSLNKIVGERTKANGFTEGYIISDGIFTKDLGGGVSQIATTTFNAMFFGGFEDVEHKPHSVYIDRYPVGREATVAWPNLDLSFRNDSPYGVLVKANVVKSTPSTQGTATVSLYSTKRWHITTTEGPRTDYTDPKTRYSQEQPCEEFSGTKGFTINVFRYFRDLKSDKVQRTEKFHTVYIPGDTVKCGKPPKNQQN
ncbi:MAG: VanW family protein [Marmoricola sp.]